MGGAESLFAMLGLAFGLGLVHALDADHVMAVSALASRGPDSAAKPAWYSVRWALGHGGALMMLGMLALGIGFYPVSDLTE